MRSAAQVFALVLVVAADAGAPPLLPPQSVLPAGSLTVIAAAQFGVAYLDPMSSNSTTAHAAASSSAATPAQAADDAEAVEAARQRRLAVLEREQRADQPAAQLSDVMLAPAKYTSVRSSGFQKLDEHSYHVQMGQLNAFLLTNGPAEVCRYNFNKVGGMHKKDLAQRLHCTSGPRVVYDHDDTFELTRKGQKKLDMNGERDLKCYALDLVCTGAHHHGAAHPLGPLTARTCSVLSSVPSSLRPRRQIRVRRGGAELHPRLLRWPGHVHRRLRRPVQAPVLRLPRAHLRLAAARC